MVEGHQCHRVAAAHRRLLVGRRFKASSPNGRFTEGAAAINDRPLVKIEVHGKNLFYFFQKAKDQKAHEIVHIHFGMSGAFKTLQRPGPEPTETTRLQLESDELDLIARVSAMTLKHGDDAYYEERIKTLGADPLREDATSDELWERVQKCKKPIGLVLMDQSMLAGVGNIYRAEILYKARVHPEQPANTVTEDEFKRIWKHSVLLLQRGYVSGSILTVDKEDAIRLGQPWTRRYIYNHKQCGECKNPVKAWDMAARTVYACETCQRLREGTELSEARRKALEGGRQAEEFVSHCASESATTRGPEKMTVAELKAMLKEAGLSTKGKKAVLVEAVKTIIKPPGTSTADAEAGTGKVKVEVTKDVALIAAGNAAESGSEEDAELEASPSASDAVARRNATDGNAVVGLVEHVALEIGADTDVSKMKMHELKAALRARSFRYERRATKPQLVEQLSWILSGEGAPLPPSTPSPSREATPSVHPEIYNWDGTVATDAAHPDVNADVSQEVRPGTQQFERIATADEAAYEKRRAGENRAVEHVALETEGAEPLLPKAINNKTETTATDITGSTLARDVQSDMTGRDDTQADGSQHPGSAPEDTKDQDTKQATKRRRAKPSVKAKTTDAPDAKFDKPAKRARRARGTESRKVDDTATATDAEKPKAHAAVQQSTAQANSIAGIARVRKRKAKA